MMERKPERGFTLVELMVVIAVVGVLVVAAVLSINPDRYAKSAKGYAEQVNATLENVRIRATSSQKWQRLEVNADSVVHMEAEDSGMAIPGAYYVVQTISVPDGVSIYALSEETHLQPATDVPDPGDGLGGFIDFAPDGSGTKATMFISGGDLRYRIAVFRATGSSRIFDEW